MNARGSDRMSNDGTTLELPDDREIRISRSFAAPARLVFEALTKPEHVKRWWAPKSRGVTLVSCDIDFKVGGRWRYVMAVRDNPEQMAFSGEYLEIEAPHRVVQTEMFEPFPDAAHVTITLTEKDGRTEMINRSVYPSKEVRDTVIATGMEHGMRESMLQLTEVVASLLR